MDGFFVGRASFWTTMALFQVELNDVITSKNTDNMSPIDGPNAFTYNDKPIQPIKVLTHISLSGKSLPLAANIACYAN